MFSKKQLIELLTPLTVEQIMAVLVGMMGMVMVATVGEAAVSGVSLVDSISALIIQTMGALAAGGAVVLAQYLGRVRSRDARKAAGQLVAMTLAFSMVMIGIAILGNRHLLDTTFERMETSVMDNTQIYFWITVLSYPFIGLYNACAALFHSMGNSKVSIMTPLVMNVISITGNAVCVFDLGIGVVGVAYPTLLSRVIVAAIILVLIQSCHNSVRFNSLKFLVPDVEVIENILSIGMPSGLEDGMFQFGRIFLQGFVSSLSTAAIAGYAIVSNLMTILYLPGAAIRLGLITIMGQCVDARRLAEAGHYAKTLTGVNCGILAVLSTTMVVFSGRLVGIYHLSKQTPRLPRELTTAHSIAVILRSLAFIIPHTLRASLDMKFAMAVAVFSMQAFRIGFAYLLVNICKLGVMGMWYGMLIDQISRAFVFSWRFKGFEKRVVVVK